MSDAPVAAVMEFKWRGDIARPVTLAFVYDVDVARDLVRAPLEEVDGRAAWLISGMSDQTARLSAIATQGVVPAAWLEPTTDMILLFQPE